MMQHCQIAAQLAQVSSILQEGTAYPGTAVQSACLGAEIPTYT